MIYVAERDIWMLCGVILDPASPGFLSHLLLSMPPFLSRTALVMSRMRVFHCVMTVTISSFCSLAGGVERSGWVEVGMAYLVSEHRGSRRPDLIAAL